MTMHKRVYCPDCREGRTVSYFRPNGKVDHEGNPIYVMKFECGHSTQIS